MTTATTFLDRIVAHKRDEVAARRERTPLAEVERDYIAAALRASGGNRAKAAERLGIGVATLYRKLKQGSIPPIPRDGE